MTCVFQSFYLSDWQGGCAFGGRTAVSICIAYGRQYTICADKLSPEKRFYYERFKALLQVINAIKTNKFGKKYVWSGQVRCKNKKSAVKTSR